MGETTTPEEPQICPDCDREIHNLDGSVSSSRDPRWKHTDCAEAARIDYPASLDRLLEEVYRLRATFRELWEETMDEEKSWSRAELDMFLVRIDGHLHRATDWDTVRVVKGLDTVNVEEGPQ